MNKTSLIILGTLVVAIALAGIFAWKKNNVDQATDSKLSESVLQNEFDPITAKIGDRFGAFMVSMTDGIATYDMSDSETITTGAISFTGQATVTGEFIAIQKDTAELAYTDLVCMRQLDAVSADQLPDQSNPTQQPAFCFDVEPEKAWEAFGSSPATGTVTATIDQYTWRGGVGAVNGARLVEIANKQIDAE